ncbi:hypothetical protein AGMMS4952_15180 [Spirochaetia bacterium]|nr:hypothetical protein AGMMS4952_15180 [Spirochaetia bacterium]
MGRGGITGIRRSTTKKTGNTRKKNYTLSQFQNARPTTNYTSNLWFANTNKTNLFVLIRVIRGYNLILELSPLNPNIELAKAVYQMKIQGEWQCSEIPKRTREIFKKIGIDCLK